MQKEGVGEGRREQKEGDRGGRKEGREETCMKLNF